MAKRRAHRCRCITRHQFPTSPSAQGRGFQSGGGIADRLGTVTFESLPAGTSGPGPQKCEMAEHWHAGVGPGVAVFCVLSVLA